MIKAAQKDVLTLVNMFKKSKPTQVAVFKSWKQYDAMLPGCKVDLIEQQVDLHIGFATLLVSGFTNNESNTMHHDIMETEQENGDKENGDKEDNIYASMTITQFISNHYKDCNGKRLFNYCNP